MSRPAAHICISIYTSISTSCTLSAQYIIFSNPRSKRNRHIPFGCPTCPGLPLPVPFQVTRYHLGGEHVLGRSIHVIERRGVVLLGTCTLFIPKFQLAVMLLQSILVCSSPCRTRSAPGNRSPLPIRRSLLTQTTRTTQLLPSSSHGQQSDVSSACLRVGQSSSRQLIMIASCSMNIDPLQPSLVFL